MLCWPAETEGVPAAEGNKWKDRKRGSCPLKRNLLEAAVGCLGLWQGPKPWLPTLGAPIHRASGQVSAWHGQAGSCEVKGTTGVDPTLFPPPAADFTPQRDKSLFSVSPARMPHPWKVPTASGDKTPHPQATTGLLGSSTSHPWAREKSSRVVSPHPRPCNAYFAKV